MEATKKARLDCSAFGQIAHRLEVTAKCRSTVPKGELTRVYKIFTSLIENCRIFGRRVLFIVVGLCVHTGMQELEFVDDNTEQ